MIYRLDEIAQLSHKQWTKRSLETRIRLYISKVSYITKPIYPCAYRQHQKIFIIFLESTRKLLFPLLISVFVCFSFVAFCISLLSIVFVISTLIIGIFYCLNYTLLLFHLFITHLVIDFIIIFVGSTKPKIVWIEITTFFKRRVSIILWYFCLKNIVIFNQTIFGDTYISHNNCLGHMLIT